MPFCSDWNPREGGSFEAGEKWIIENIGKRPVGSTLNIIDHAIGFVPGNLEWAYPKGQSRNQMCLIIARQKHIIKELTSEIEELRRRLA